MFRLIHNLIADEEGATAVEYGLIALDVSLQSLFTTIAGQIDGAVQGGGSTT
jgi:Flp pilus assembly pilin Flp